MSNNCVYINRVIYCVNHYACDIAAFSVGDEKFIRMIPFPVGEWTVRFEESNPRIGDMKGQVALLGHVYFKRGTIVLYILSGTSETGEANN